jgi:hypothetical protein
MSAEGWHCGTLPVMRGENEPADNDGQGKKEGSSPAKPLCEALRNTFWQREELWPRTNLKKP